MGTETTTSCPAVRRPLDALILHATSLCALLAVAALAEPDAHWHLEMLLVIGGFSTVSALTEVNVASTRMSISGSLLGIVLAAVLLGAVPAAVLSIVVVTLGWFRRREAAHYLRNNTLTYAWFPLLSGVFFHFMMGATHIAPLSPTYYLLVFATFVVAMVLNFFGVAGYQSFLDGSSMIEKTREVLIPVLSAELFAGFLTIVSVYVAIRIGVMGLALFGLVLILFQYLIGELLTSKQRADKLHLMATTDALTGLANREFFRGVLDEWVASSTHRQFLVMLLDLDHFKEINDTLGHDYGDKVLRELGPRLAEGVGENGLVARLGGDEFALVFADRETDAAAAELAATELIAQLREPFRLDELTLELDASIGITRFPEDGEDGHTLLRRADVAMYSAKEEGSDWKLYARELDHHSVRRLSVLSRFRQALQSDELEVHYQPIVEVKQRAACGAEALLRWQQPEGLVSAGEFIQVIEQSGLIAPLTRYVLERSIAECSRWRQLGHALTVAVNLSVRNLLDRTLPDDIRALLDRYSLHPDALQLEITESMLMADPERSMRTVMRLSDLGLRMSVDDFGTGFSSLVNLRQLPIDHVKIDRTFVSGMLNNESDLIIVRSTINLAHDLGLYVTAEGVEDEPTLDHLHSLGCDLAQGYLLSRPLPPRDFWRWTQEFRRSEPPPPPRLAVVGA